MKRECCGAQTWHPLLLCLHRAQGKRTVTFKRRARFPSWGFREKCFYQFLWEETPGSHIKDPNFKWLTCSQKSESVTWLTAPPCPIMAALQRIWPAHCAHANCPGDYLHVWAGPPAWRHSECWLTSLAALTLCIAPLSPGSFANGLLSSYGHKVAT